MLSEDTMVKVAALARAALERTYVGTCEVREHVSVVDAETGLTRPQGAQNVIYDALPCRLSFESVHSALETETGSTVKQGVKLFCQPDVTIKPGSEIVVVQNGVTMEYLASGQPAVYPTHQEISLELKKECA